MLQAGKKHPTTPEAAAAHPAEAAGGIDIHELGLLRFAAFRHLLGVFNAVPRAAASCAAAALCCHPVAVHTSASLQRCWAEARHALWHWAPCPAPALEAATPAGKATG